MFSIKRFICYFLKQASSYIFYYLGGVYLLKALFRHKKALLILVYHNFITWKNFNIDKGNLPEPDYVKNFEKQIRFLKRNFNFCYPEEYFKGTCADGINILITFDDGYKDNFDIALPILMNNNASAIFFITTNYIGSKKWLWHDKVRFLTYQGKLDKSDVEYQLKNLNKGCKVDDSFIKYVNNNFPNTFSTNLMLNWDEVDGMVFYGFRIGSHTANHVPLSSVLAEKQEHEIILSKKTIEYKTKKDCNYIAYPNGLFNNDTLTILDVNSIDFGFTAEPGINWSFTNKKQLKRIGINARDSTQVLLFRILISIVNENLRLYKTVWNYTRN